MTDSLTTEHRSWNMSRIRSKNTKPELIVRSLLHRMGYRFSLRSKALPGHPDIVLPKYGTVVFVHGCFWHRHSGCSNATTPGTRVDFWQKKFADNVARDRRSQRILKRVGWVVIVVWECQIFRDPTGVGKKLDSTLRSKRQEFARRNSEADANLRKSRIKRNAGR